MAYDTLDTILEHEIGRFTVKAEKVIDDSPQFDYLGSFEPKMDWNPETYVYHRPSRLMYDGKLWRDHRGRIQAEPELDSHWSHECEFIALGSCQFTRKDEHSLTYAFQNATMLDRLDSDWSFVGIVATVSLEGREIGSSSCYGFEDIYSGKGAKDSDKYLLEEARSIVRDAIHDARSFLSKVCTA